MQDERPFLVAADEFLVGVCGGSSSLTRDSTWAPCIGSTVLATGPPAKSLYDFVLFFLVEETLVVFPGPYD